MKENIKKLSVLVGVLVIALFIMVVVASAGPAIPYSIKGVYAVTGFSTCDATSPGIMEATYTFKNDGTGSLSGFGRNIYAAKDGDFVAFMCDFTYTVTKEGLIEFKYPQPPVGKGGIKVGFVDDDGVFHTNFTMNGGPSHGVISSDDKTITISCGPPKYLKVIDPITGAELSPPVWCITTLAGMRIK
jgi:hypothetical protein